MNDRVLIVETEKGRIKAYGIPLKEKDRIVKITTHQADNEQIKDEWVLK